MIPKVNEVLDVVEAVDRIEYFCPEPYAFKSAQRTLEDEKGHCLDGAFVACMLLEQLGFDPRILDFHLRPESGEDVGHSVSLFSAGGEYFTIGQSSVPGMKHRLRGHWDLRELAENYAAAASENNYRTLSAAVVEIRELPFDWRYGDAPFQTELCDFINSQSLVSIF